jgi:GNAT superfamily N-acetyltransferase
MSLGERREDLGPPLPDAYYAAFEQIEADPRQRLLVIVHGRRVVGTASFIILPNLSYGGRPHAIIENVVVEESERGKGLGERLVRYCLDQARAAGCTHLSLTTDARRLDAHRFYERLGLNHSHKGYRYTFAGGH